MGEGYSPRGETGDGLARSRSSSLLRTSSRGSTSVSRRMTTQMRLSTLMVWLPTVNTLPLTCVGSTRRLPVMRTWHGWCSKKSSGYKA